MLPAHFKHTETQPWSELNMLWRKTLQGQGEGDVGRKMGKGHVPLLLPDLLQK